MPATVNIKQEKRNKDKAVLKSLPSGFPIKELINATHLLKDFGRRVIKKINKKKGN